ncbi:hypothetical protein [Clostridium estertheticum]|uniref:hypothetical protein n=1 Tax=Clostridium estertheticum TaxID=238834 RepID=UPI001CF43DBF|nr:hypothetical protein [Clostridium estertheticum]MCB2362200.1 hypothetical protein [Clostridium estertheticum]
MSDDIKELVSSYAVKLDGNVKEELLQLLEGYKLDADGANAGDFVKMLLEVYKTNKLVRQVVGSDAELKELNTITNRIYSIYGNILERNNTRNNALQIEFGEQSTQKDAIINGVKEKLQEQKEEYILLQNTFNNCCEDKIKLEADNRQLQKLNDSLEFNNSKLVYDTNSLLEEKKVNNKLSLELEELKKLLADSQTKNIDLDNTIKNNVTTINGLNKEIEKATADNNKSIIELQSKQDAAVEMLKEKAIYAKDKALLDLDKIHQEQILKLNNKREEEIEQYQNKITEHQTKYNMLLDKVEELRSIPKTKK